MLSFPFSPYNIVMGNMKDKNENVYTRICGQNIRRLRKQEKYSLEKLAELLDCSDVTLGRAERGVQNMKIWRLVRFCDLFHVSLDDLYRGEGGTDSSTVPSYVVDLFQGADAVELEILSDHIISASREIERYHSLEKALKAYRNKEEANRNKKEASQNSEEDSQNKKGSFQSSEDAPWDEVNRHRDKNQTLWNEDPWNDEGGLQSRRKTSSPWLKEDDFRDKE